MNDLISRQAVLDVMETLDKFRCDPDGKLVRYDDDKHYIPYVHYEDMVHAIKHLPSAQPELPKQFMSDDCISRSELYKKVCEAEKLARGRVLDTPSDSPFPNKLNPAYIRYSAQLNERTQFKHMIADARSVQPELRC